MIHLLNSCRIHFCFRAALTVIALTGSPSMKRILIAEDEPKIAAFMQKGLNRSGFLTNVVADGNQVLSKMLEDSYDLVLLDLGLPEKDGLVILKEMQQRNIHIPIIVVTARSIDPQDAQMIQMAGTEIVSKPFLMKDLIQKVRSLLS